MWPVLTTDTFDDWYSKLDEIDRTNVLASMIVLSERGPILARPYSDTIKSSEFPNLKELRVQSKGKPIRLFYAFDPLRRAILLCAGSKVGLEKRFYKIMISIADREFRRHMTELHKESKDG